LEDTFILDYMTDDQTARYSEFQDDEIKTNIVGKGITRFSFIEPHQIRVSLYRELFRLAINRQKFMTTGFQLFSFNLANRLTIPAIRLSALWKTFLFHLKYFEKVKVFLY
jgi:hypothetical protein